MCKTLLKHHFKLELMFGCENPFSMIEQPFEHIAVLDFEATCKENSGRNYQNEIIEFPLVLIDVKQQLRVLGKRDQYAEHQVRVLGNQDRQALQKVRGPEKTE